MRGDLGSKWRAFVVVVVVTALMTDGSTGRRETWMFYSRVTSTSVVVGPFISRPARGYVRGDRAAAAGNGVASISIYDSAPAAEVAAAASAVTLTTHHPSDDWQPITQRDDAECVDIAPITASTLLLRTNSGADNSHQPRRCSLTACLQYSGRR